MNSEVDDEVDDEVDGEEDMSFLQYDLHKDRLTEVVKVYLRKELIPLTKLRVCVTGAVCWTHRDDSTPNCEMQVLPVAQTRAGHRLILIFHDHIAQAIEPQLVCGKSRKHHQAKGFSTDVGARYHAIRHSRTTFPKSTSDQRRRLYHIACCSGETNLVQAYNLLRNELEIVYKVTDSCFISADALIEANNHVWDTHSASASIVYPCLTTA